MKNYDRQRIDTAHRRRIEPTNKKKIFLFCLTKCVNSRENVRVVAFDRSGLNITSMGLIYKSKE